MNEKSRGARGRFVRHHTPTAQGVGGTDRNAFARARATRVEENPAAMGRRRARDASPIGASDLRHRNAPFATHREACSPLPRFAPEATLVAHLASLPFRNVRPHQSEGLVSQAMHT